MAIIAEGADIKVPYEVPVQQVTAATQRLQDGQYLGSVRPETPPTGASRSYSPSYHATPLLPPSPPPPSYPTLPHPTLPAPAVRRRRTSCGRFWSAFVFALLIYLAILSLTRSIIRMANGRSRDEGPAGFPRSDDGRILESIGSLNWSSYQSRPFWAPTFSEGAETSFTLPVASETLYLISRGSYQAGNVQVKQSTTERGRDVKVDVRVAYNDERALARATVCRLRKSGNRQGVGIYTPTSGWSGVRDRLHFEVVLTFPAAPSEHFPLRINEFTTNTNNFAHEIDDLWQSLLFEHMELNTSNAPIRASSVTLTKGTLTTSNGAIIGHFNTSDALILHTSNARIQTTVSLFSAGRHATKLDMQTSNGAIGSSVSLTTESGSGGNFVVMARSSNGMIDLQYDDSPMGAHLVSDVRTSNGAASVAMHPAYEGTYEVSTSNAQPVVRDTHPADPSGRGRRRVVGQSTSRGTVSGRVHWAGGDGRHSVEGVSTVHTSNAQASLDL